VDGRLIVRRVKRLNPKHVGPGQGELFPDYTATIRRQLIAVPARLASSARRLVLHLPRDWPWQDSWEGLFATACGPPTPTTT
jgi:hypothetical protein